MSEPIKVGDLVMILRTHCEFGAGGRIGTVLEIALPHTGPCGACGKPITACAGRLEVGGELVGWNPLQWLKRIPPLGDLDGKKDAADKPITLDGQIERLRKMVRA